MAFRFRGRRWKSCGSNRIAITGKQGLYGPPTIAKLAKQLISDGPVNLRLNEPVADSNNETAA